MFVVQKDWPLMGESLMGADKKSPDHSARHHTKQKKTKK